MVTQYLLSPDNICFYRSGRLARRTAAERNHPVHLAVGTGHLNTVPDTTHAQTEACGWCTAGCRRCLYEVPGCLSQQRLPGIILRHRRRTSTITMTTS